MPSSHLSFSLSLLFLILHLIRPSQYLNSILSSVGKSRLRMSWAEDICWVTENTLAVGAARREGERETRQVGLVHIEEVNRVSEID